MITGYPNPYGSRLTPRPLFMPFRDAFPITQTEFMEPRRVLPSLRKSNAAPADCTHSLLGLGRNRHVSAAPFLCAASEKNVPNKTLLRASANKSCAGSGPENLVAGAVAYHGKRVKRVFCAAVPIFNIPIIACWQNIVTFTPRPFLP